MEKNVILTVGGKATICTVNHVGGMIVTVHTEDGDRVTLTDKQHEYVKMLINFKRASF